MRYCCSNIQSRLGEGTQTGGAEKFKGFQSRQSGRTARGGCMKSFRFVLMAMLLAVPLALASKANAQVGVGVGVGPAVVDAPYAYGPPDCAWGYYPYYPYGCAPYGYYGANWFVGGLFIGAGPWYHWGWYGHPGYGWGYRGGYGYRGGFAGRGGYGYGGVRGYAGGAHGYAGGG